MINTHTSGEGDQSVFNFLKYLIGCYKIDQKDFYAPPLAKVMRDVDILIETVNSFFAAKATVYFRHEVGMHPVIGLFAAYLSKKVISRSWSKFYYSEIVKTPMDIIMIMNFVKDRNMFISNAMKKGFVKAFNKFSRNELASCQNQGGSMSLVDIVNLIHPKHNESIRALVAGELPVLEQPCGEVLSIDNLLSVEDKLKNNAKILLSDICEIKFK